MFKRADEVRPGDVVEIYLHELGWYEVEKIIPVQNAVRFEFGPDFPLRELLNTTKIRVRD